MTGSAGHPSPVTHPHPLLAVVKMRATCKALWLEKGEMIEYKSHKVVNRIARNNICSKKSKNKCVDTGI